MPPPPLPARGGLSLISHLGPQLRTRKRLSASLAQSRKRLYRCRQYFCGSKLYLGGVSVTGLDRPVPGLFQPSLGFAGAAKVEFTRHPATRHKSAERSAVFS